jgi:hypothetical protein
MRTHRVAGEGRRDDAEVPDDLPVVASEPQDAPQGSSRPWSGPRGNRCDLVSVHGDASSGDHVAEIGHRGRPKRTLGTLEVQMVGAEGVEDEADVLQVFGPRRAVNQNVIEKH